jgi:hypothetical protein
MTKGNQMNLFPQALKRSVFLIMFIAASNLIPMNSVCAKAMSSITACEQKSGHNMRFDLKPARPPSIHIADNPENAAMSQTSSAEIVEKLKQATQELLDAIAPGRKEVWEKYLAEGSIYADEEGNVKTKEELLKELNPLPKGYIGSIKMGEPKVLVQDNVIALSHRDREDLELYGQNIVTYFHSTDTWARQKDGQWRIVATQIMAIPNERKPIAINPQTLDSYAGQYQLSPEVTYTITREGEKLFGQRTGRAREELLPLCVDIFYRKGVWRGEKVFERDAQGRVIKMLDRRENNDLVWKKVK